MKRATNMLAVSNCILLLVFILHSNVKAQEGDPWDLPKSLIPVKYTLTLITFLETNNLSFSGDVVIEINCVTETDRIVLHAKDLTIGETDVLVKMLTTDNKEVDLQISSHGYGDENDFYIIVMADMLVQNGVYFVIIKFTGNLSDNLNGYYYVSYEQDGETKYSTSTWLEPIGARGVFPCWDEPALKASFIISMGHAPNLKAVSNMQWDSSTTLIIEGRNDWVLDTFKESPFMSTYLVGLTLGEYEFVPVPADGLTFDIGIWIRSQYLQQIELAKETVVGAVKFFANYLRLDYALKKLDLVAVLDQSRGGMETYGMITLSEGVITYDPNSSNVISEYATAQIICNSVCHQWIGNYVTMKVWRDLWLNEGFCFYFEDICVGHVFPDWQTIDQMFFRKYLIALTADGLTSSRPIIVPITSLADVDQIFDRITYEKGSVVVRMLSMFLGDDVFQEGLANYIQAHAFSSATSDDLWATLADVAIQRQVLPENLTLKQIMDSWTTQPGYPYVDVEIDYVNKFATLSQKRYFSEDLSGSENSNLCYDIPVSYTTSVNPSFDNPKPTIWLTCAGSITIPAPIDEKQWLLINIKVAGFYRTKYGEQNLKALQAALSQKDTLVIIDILDRAQIISNIFGMSWTCHLKYETTFTIIKYLEIEDAYIPWRTALELLHDMRDLLVRTDIFQPFQKFVRSFLEPKFLSIGDITKIPDDFMSYRYFTLLIYWACIYDVKNCHDQSIAIFQTWLQQSDPDAVNPILPNLRDIVYCEAMKTGGEPIFDFMWTRYTNSNVPNEQYLILTALGCTRDKALLQRILEWTIDSSKIRKEDSAQAFWTVVNNEIGFDLAADFFFKRFKDILNYHGSKSLAIQDDIETLTEMMMSKDDLQRFDAFVQTEGDLLDSFTFAIQSGYDRIRKNIDWEDKHLDELTKFLSPSN